jgi:hypothetical protein
MSAFGDDRFGETAETRLREERERTFTSWIKNGLVELAHKWMRSWKVEGFADRELSVTVEDGRVFLIIVREIRGHDTGEKRK